MYAGNAIKNADTPVMDKLSESKEGFTTLDASGKMLVIMNKAFLVINFYVMRL